MSLLKRKLVCERLRLKRRASYRIIGASRLSFISSDDVLALLNDAQRPLHVGMERLTEIPSDLRTPEEMAAEIGGVTAHDLLNWTRRKKNVPPHFRLNHSTTRFSSRRMMAWIEERAHSYCKKRVA